ncbi:MAG: type II toxin-antitoxin system VapC family toxin [Proteobacteria bacterium]|nr:type II toxin-antitoxin system VapC family toxin [Pseudomonadota bacterium]
MRYWDSSAIVPLLVAEPGSDLVRACLREDPHMVTWVLSRLELAGAVERRSRQGLLDGTGRRELLDRLATLAAHADEVTEVLAVRQHALLLLARHALRAADAAQLAAAYLASEGNPSSLTFVCLDRALARAAELEGFAVLTWER